MKTLLLALLLLGASVASADCATTCYANCHVQAGKAFSVSANHAGVDTVGFRLYLNGVLKANLPLASLQGGVIRFKLSSIANGTYVAKIVAYNAAGESGGLTVTLIATNNGK